MGQKITEHPAVDQWVKLMREAKKAGATYQDNFRRPARDAHEWDQYQGMARAMTRTTIGYGAVPASAEGLTLCEACGTLIRDPSRAFHRRTTYPANGDPVRSYLCPTCAGIDEA